MFSPGFNFPWETGADSALRLAMATLQEGETVLDIGSGGGFDAFLAAKKVGKTGQVIGVVNCDYMIP